MEPQTPDPLSVGRDPLGHKVAYDLLLRSPLGAPSRSRAVTVVKVAAAPIPIRNIFSHNGRSGETGTVTVKRVASAAVSRAPPLARLSSAVLDSQATVAETTLNLVTLAAARLELAPTPPLELVATGCKLQLRRAARRELLSTGSTVQRQVRVPSPLPKSPVMLRATGAAASSVKLWHLFSHLPCHLLP
ncbi:putative solute carrier family 17 member 9 [Sesbania bispinosa]|nr:putative solute carrier family 17 member 9 [Sesbania bispinosa]